MSLSLGARQPPARMCHSSVLGSTSPCIWASHPRGRGGGISWQVNFAVVTFAAEAPWILCEKFRGHPRKCCGAEGFAGSVELSHRCQFRASPWFLSLTANLKRERSHAKSTAPETPPPPDAPRCVHCEPRFSGASQSGRGQAQWPCCVGGEHQPRVGGLVLHRYRFPESGIGHPCPKPPAQGRRGDGPCCCCPGPTGVPHPLQDPSCAFPVIAAGGTRILRHLRRAIWGIIALTQNG